MASDEQFSLCWNNFHANMSAGFHGLLSRGDLVDVTLAAEGRLLQAHKLVLSVCSPYFQEMFKLNPTQHPIVFLKDVSHSALRDLLQFMYQGEVNVKQEELASFISTAEQLQVKGLTGNQNEESSTPSKPKPTSRPGPRSSQQRQSVMTKLETDLDSKPSSTPVAVKRPNRPSIASNNSSSSQSGPAKRKCVDPLEAGPSGSAKDEFVTIPDEDENNAVAPKMEPEFVNESMWDDEDDGANNDETNFGEDDSNMEMTGFDGSTTGDGNITGGGEGGAVGDAQASKRYTAKILQKALDEINNGVLSVYKASKLYQIPNQTLYDKLNNRHTKKLIPGAPTVLKPGEEVVIKEWILKITDAGFIVSRRLLSQSAAKFVTEPDQPDKLRDQLSRSWLLSFLKRYPIIKERVVKTFNASRICATATEVKAWFKQVSSYLKANNLFDVLEDPSRIFHLDESAYYIGPKGQSVLVKKGIKNEFCKYGTVVKETLTLALGASADGKLMPTFAIFPSKGLPNMDKYPLNWACAGSDNRWMTPENFYEYMAHVFNPVLVTEGIKKPVILFLDGHVAYLSLEVTKFCRENGIVLMALIPSSNYILHPLEKAIFQHLKDSWRNHVHAWRKDNNNGILPQENFGTILEGCINETITPDMIQAGFRNSGIYPFDENAVVYSE